MTTIKIKRLSLENFKCHDSLVLDFNGNNASIYGDNASGKSSVYDALTWLLFGKDSRGNGEKNIEIKPLKADGTVRDHHAITSVEAVLLVDDTEVSLRRTLQEVWSTKRGSIEATYDGNTSEYFIDGVPCKKYAFTNKIDELVSEDLFRMLTSVSYFASEMPWQDRRDVLFKVSGAMSDLQILQTKEEFAPIIEGMGRLSIDDYKKKLFSEKRAFVGVRDEIPARISECQKTINDLGNIDFTEARLAVDSLVAEKEKLNAELLAIEHSSALDEKMLAQKQAQLAIDELESKNRLYRESQMQGQPDTRKLEMQVADAKNKILLIESRMKKYNDSLLRVDDQIAVCRQNWMEESARVFGAALNCPTCGQALPADQIAIAREAFEADKQRKLRDIEDTANRLKVMKADTEEEIKICEDEIKQYKKDVLDLDVKIKFADSHKVEVADMEGYKDTSDSLRTWLNQILEEVRVLREDSYAASKATRDKISDINVKINEAMAVAGKESALRYAEKRIEELQEEAQKAAENLQKIESLIYLIEEFTRYKTSFVEDSINGMFRIARFRLFREQANGGVEDRCDVVYEGVPYICVNSGAKINLGIDIINTLSEVYGISVPLFVDNAESVTNIEAAKGQIIRLVVSENDKELRINYEN